MSDPFRVDRRTTIKWVIAAAASLPAIRRDAFAEGNAAASAPAAAAKGYGTDPDLTRIYAPGDLWPLTFTAAERRTATVLCDLILPADAKSPSASAVGVVDFIDEWISAPYQDNAGDRTDHPRGISVARCRVDAALRAWFCRRGCAEPGLDLRRHLLPAEIGCAARAGRPVLRAISRPDRGRLLYDAGRHA